eukprot:4765484-Prorocentrum_lima.AAC.1
MLATQRVGLPLLRLQDNEPCIRKLPTEVPSWRSRHYAPRAAWIRDVIVHESVLVKYQPGKDIIADGLTKVPQKGKLREAGRRLLLQDVTK